MPPRLQDPYLFFSWHQNPCPHLQAFKQPSAFLWEGPDLGLERWSISRQAKCRTTQVPLRSSLWGIKIYFGYHTTFLSLQSCLDYYSQSWEPRPHVVYMSFIFSEALSSPAKQQGVSNISRLTDDLFRNPDWVIMVVESGFPRSRILPLVTS